MPMIQCERCGNTNSDIVNICGYCGATLGDEEEEWPPFDKEQERSRNLIPGDGITRPKPKRPTAGDREAQTHRKQVIARFSWAYTAGPFNKAERKAIVDFFVDLDKDDWECYRRLPDLPDFLPWILDFTPDERKKIAGHLTPDPKLMRNKSAFVTWAKGVLREYGHRVDDIEGG